MSVVYLGPRPVRASGLLDRFGYARREMLKAFLALAGGDALSAEQLRDEIEGTTGAMTGILYLVEPANDRK